MAGNLTNDELQRIWLEEVVVYPRYYPGICLLELRKLAKTVRTGGVPSEVRTEHIRDIFRALPLCQSHRQVSGKGDESKQQY
jgi:hypothetical protein